MTWTRLLLGGVLLLGLWPQGPGCPPEARGGEQPRDDLRAAELHYLELLRSADNGQRRKGYEELLKFYARVGSYNLAVLRALEYDRLLQDARDWGRLRWLRVQLGEYRFALGHWRKCESTLEDALNGSWGSAPLSDPRRLTAQALLAHVAQKRGDRDRALERWRQVESQALKLLENPRLSGHLTLPGPLRIEYTRRLAESYRSQEKLDQAAAALESLLPVHEQLRDPKGLGETLKLLGDYRLAQAGRDADRAAERSYRTALDLLEKSRAGDQLLQGDLHAGLAEVFRRRGQKAEVDSQVEKAAGAYREILKLSRQRQRPKGEGWDVSGLTAFWKLQQLYQRVSQYQKALSLAEEQTGPWGGPLLRPRLSAEQGSLKAILSVYQEALPLLADAVDQLQRQDPPNLVELPRALNNLALVESVTDKLAAAEEHGRECLDLYRRHELPADPVQVEACNLVGTALALRGEYAEAIKQYRLGVQLCGPLKAQAGAQHLNLLLNIALLHKAQGDLVQALRDCQEAEEVCKQFAPEETLIRGALLAARASILTAQAEVSKAYELVGPLQEICRQHGIQGGLLWSTVLRCQGLQHLQRNEFDLAEETLQKLEQLQEREKQALLLPRTLNYLALSREKQGQFAEAERRYRRAYQLQQSSPRTYPRTHFITCWRLASVLDRLSRREEARPLLQQAIGIVEAVRLKTYGGTTQRANYFAEFEPAFDQLVAWSLESGDPREAFSAMARGRSRTLMDQLQAAHVDPRSLLHGPEGEALRRQEEEVRRRLGAMRAQVQLIAPEEMETARTEKLLRDLDAVQDEYANVWKEVVNASPIYRSLSADDPSKRALAMLSSLGPKTMLLVYYLGREKGWLLLGRSGKLEAFPLAIPALLAQQAVPPPPLALGEALTSTRAMQLRPRPNIPPPPPPPEAGTAVSPGPNEPLSRESARVAVENYLRQIADPLFQPTRAFVLRPRQPTQPVPPQRLELLGDVVLPREVRDRIREANPDTLLVVPDGALHRLPLEALLFQAGDRPRYLLDELPPLVYCPSLAVLAMLNEQKPPPPGPLSLLTVANPAYPVPGALQRLPGTATESERIRGYFDPKLITALTEADATKARVVAAVRGQRMIHLAVHGFADEKFGLFGALALAPPAPRPDIRPLALEGSNEALLELPEIFTLPLQNCELAVLSACTTNVGLQQQLEAGVTLASGFLAAGARHVVASHWSVDDRSTAELMGKFFEEVTRTKGKRDSASYARALKQAQLKLRNDPDRSSPYFWAPFVLLGPAWG